MLPVAGAPASRRCDGNRREERSCELGIGMGETLHGSPMWSGSIAWWYMMSCEAWEFWQFGKAHGLGLGACV